MFITRCEFSPFVVWYCNYPTVADPLTQSRGVRKEALKIGTRQSFGEQSSFETPSIPNCEQANSFEMSKNATRDKISRRISRTRATYCSIQTLPVHPERKLMQRWGFRMALLIVLTFSASSQNVVDFVGNKAHPRSQILLLQRHSFAGVKGRLPSDTNHRLIRWLEEA